MNFLKELKNQLIIRIKITGSMKKLLLLLLFPVVCFGQISEWYYDVRNGDAFSEDKPYILVISSEKIDGIYRPTLMLSKRGGNDYYSLMIIDIGYLSDNDDDLKIEIAFSIDCPFRTSTFIK